MSLKKNLLLIYLVYFSRVAVYLLLFPLLIRRLGDGWGEFATALSFVQVAATAIEFGFGVSATKNVAKHRSSILYLSRLVRSIVLIQIILFLVVSVIGIPLIYLPVLHRFDSYLYVLLIIFFQGSSPLWFLRGVEDMLLISMSEVVSKVGILLLIYLFVTTSTDANNAFMIYFVGAFIPTVVGYLYIYKRYLVKVEARIYLRDLKDQFNSGFIFFSVRLSGMFISVGGSLMLGVAGYTKLAGIFAIAERILAGIRSILLPAWDIIFPKIISLLSDDQIIAEKFRKKSILMMVFFSMLISLVLLFSAPGLVKYFAGSIDSGAVILVQIMFVAPVFVSVINSLGLGYLISHDHDVVFMLSIVAGFISYFCFLLYVSFLSHGSEPTLSWVAYIYDFSLAVSMALVIFFVNKLKATEV